MISIVSVRLPTGDTPVATVALDPYILVRRGDTVQSAEDMPAESDAPGGSPWQLRSRWFRSSIPRGGAVCGVHPEKEATVQCAVCLRARAPQHLSYHCSPECFRSSWPQHLEYHRQAQANPSERSGAAAGRARGFVGAEGCSRKGWGVVVVHAPRGCAPRLPAPPPHARPRPLHPTLGPENGYDGVKGSSTTMSTGETWVEVGRSRRGFRGGGSLGGGSE
jgi:hypothetical protein